jgi:hypothetical protein
MKSIFALKVYIPILLKICLSILGSITASILVAVLLDELGILSSPSDRLTVTILLSLLLSFVCLVALSRALDGFDEKKISYEAYEQIKQASRSRQVAAALLFVFGLTAVIFAARAVDYATGDIQSFGVSSNLQAAYDRNADSISNFEQEMASRVLTQSEEEIADFNNRMDRLLATQSALGSELRAAKSASSLINEDGTVKQIFLFQYFSSLFVRLGTLGIVLILFGVILRQYRRYEKQILEVRQISLAIRLTKEGYDPQLLTGLRTAMLVDDEAKVGDKNELDTVFSSAYISYITSVADNMKKNLS